MITEAHFKMDFKMNENHCFSDFAFALNTGVIQLIPPVLSSETLLHISLSSEYSGFRPSTTAVVTQPVHT